MFSLVLLGSWTLNSDDGPSPPAISATSCSASGGGSVVVPGAPQGGPRRRLSRRRPAFDNRAHADSGRPSGMAISTIPGPSRVLSSLPWGELNSSRHPATPVPATSTAVVVGLL